MDHFDGLDLVGSHAYSEKGVPHDLWTRLRAESPVHRCTPAGFEPFWAITKHADICEISKQPDKWYASVCEILQDESQSTELKELLVCELGRSVTTQTRSRARLRKILETADSTAGRVAAARALGAAAT